MKFRYGFIFGKSMKPFLNSGEFLKLGPPEDIKVGDVVAFKREGKSNLVIHRVIAIDGDHFLVKGDNEPYSESVKREMIVNKFIKKYYSLRRS
jgi:signal peptidase I